MRSKPPKVALLIETSNSFARGLLVGIDRYIRSERRWDVYLRERSRGDAVPDWIKDWDGDGILARVENEKIAASLRSLKVPIVDLSSFRLLPNIPAVTTDNEKIAYEAFQHFFERGFRNFAFCGVERFMWSRARGWHFERFVRESGGKCAVYGGSNVCEGTGFAETEAIATWLHDLPKPVAVFAAYDARGHQVLVACQRAGHRVPEDVAVLGVDNDELMCELALPPLSSVIPDTQRAGWTAANLLARMMGGEKVDAEAQLISPLGVATRQSTDTLAVDDQRMSGVLRYIREHATKGLRVEQVLKRFPMARRALERQMKKLIGRTPQEEIRRVQIARAQQLLSDTKIPVSDMAERCGFRYAEYLSVAFKRETGMSPSEYRRQHGLR